MIANLSFDFDGYVIDGGTVEYFPDPVYENFSGNSRIYKSANKRLEITVSLGDFFIHTCNTKFQFVTKII